MRDDFNVYSICVTIIVLSCIIAITVYNIHENVLKSRNIESAISKGVDPLSVRCSYASQQDLLCVAYAATGRNREVK